MWTNAEMVKQEQKTNCKKKIYFHRICEFSSLSLRWIFKNARKLSDLSQVALIYQESLYLQTAEEDLNFIFKVIITSGHLKRGGN